MSAYSENAPCLGIDTGEGSFDADLLMHLLGLPHKILAHHESSGLAPLVLHELAHDIAFNFSRAGYLVNNPDFDCVRGFAGYHVDDCQHHSSDMWSDADSFASAIQHAPFHQKIATFFDKALAGNADGSFNEEDLKHLAANLGFGNPLLLTWKMRHGNQGILLYEGDEIVRKAHHQELLNHFVPMLGMC